MAKKDKKNKKGQQGTAGTGVPVVVEPSPSGSGAGAVVEQPAEAGVQTAEQQPKKKTYYNPATAKAYRERIKEFAVKGGYTPKERQPGSGLTEKRTSKTGTTYYYQPWNTLSEDQKKQRLAQARDRMAKDRADAAKYREEHPELFQKKQ